MLSNVLSMLYDAGTRHQKPLKAFFPLETEKAAVQKLYFQLKILGTVNTSLAADFCHSDL